MICYFNLNYILRVDFVLLINLVAQMLSIVCKCGVLLYTAEYNTLSYTTEYGI